MTEAHEMIADLIRDLLRMGISQTKAIMHITEAMGYDQNASLEAKRAVGMAKVEVDTMIEVIESLAKRYASAGGGNE